MDLLSIMGERLHCTLREYKAWSGMEMERVNWLTPLSSWI